MGKEVIQMCFFSEPSQEEQMAAARVGLIALGYTDPGDFETLLEICMTIREVTEAGMIATQTPISLPALMKVLDSPELEDEQPELEPEDEPETIVDEGGGTYDVWVCRLNGDGVAGDRMFPKPMRRYDNYEEAAEFIQRNWTVYHSESARKTLDLIHDGRRVSFVVEE